MKEVGDDATRAVKEVDGDDAWWAAQEVGDAAARAVKGAGDDAAQTVEKVATTPHGQGGEPRKLGGPAPARPGERLRLRG